MEIDIELKRGHICYRCNSDQYPTGKPIDSDDHIARKEEDGSCTCGECVIEDLNKRNIL